MKGRILLVDDEEQLRKLLARMLKLEGLDIEEAGTLKAAADLLRRKEIDVVLCDVKLPDGNGVDFVREVKKAHPLTEVISLTAYGNIADGVRAIKHGGFDYITKGNDNDRILPLLHQALEKVTRQRQQAIQVKGEPGRSIEDIIGQSKSIQQAKALAARIAPTEASVLLLGETGTGKEVFAHALHGASKRSARAFVAINCSAFARELLEGELFGHKAGAYTGAIKDKAGLVELADGGTLFLDEIGEMNIDLQAKLLRVLENGEFIKLGDTRTSKVNLRVIAATHRNLEESIAQGSFREDLFYRLNVFSILLPSLRERREDIPLLARTFLQQFASREGSLPAGLSPQALELLQAYSWKGNIRELKNVIERALILSGGDTLLPEHLPYEVQRPSAPDSLSLASVERKHIEKILKHTGGNKTRAAETLGIGLTTLYRKMEEYGLPK